MKKVKNNTISIKYLLVMIFITFLITGCDGWKDVQDNYGDILNKGVTCTYYSTEKNSEDDYFKIKTLELSADYNGMYVRFNSGNKYTIINVDKTYNTIEAPSSDYLNFSNSFLESYLTKYKDNSKCLESIYISWDVNSHEVRTDDCEGMGYTCSMYTLGTVTVSDQNGEDIDCHYSLATTCDKFTKSKDQFGNKVYLEFGYYKQNGTTKKYFGVASDANYKDITLDYDESDGFILHHNLEWYEIPEEAFSEIWLSNNKIISKNDIVIKPFIGTSVKYYITGPNSANYGEDFETGEVEDAPNIDPENEYSNYDPKQDLTYDENAACDSLLGKINDKNAPAYYINFAFNLIKYIAIVLLFVLTIVDFAKATASSKDDAIKKAAVNALKRLIIAAIIFFLPILINFLLELLGWVTDPTCGIGGVK